MIKAHKILCFLWLFVSTISLAQKKAQEVDLTKLPCFGPDFNSTKTHYRGAGYAISSDYTIARDKAMILAKEELANSIKSEINSVTSIYTSQNSKTNSFKQEFESINNESVNETLEGVKVICQKQEKQKGNKIKVFIAVELGVFPVLEKIEEKVYSHQNLKVNFDKAAFEKIFNEEMQKIETKN